MLSVLSPAPSDGTIGGGSGKSLKALTEGSDKALGLVYTYVRVSTDRQAEEGESLGVQERTIAGYAATSLTGAMRGGLPVGPRGRAGGS